MAAMMQRRLGAKLRTADDYATADEKEIKELSAMTGIKYKQPARRPQPKRIAAPASTLMNLNELKQLAEEDGSPVKARKALAPPGDGRARRRLVEHAPRGDRGAAPAPARSPPPRASSTASVRRKQKAASAAFVASASTAAVASNRQATAGRKKTAPRRKRPTRGARCAAASWTTAPARLSSRGERRRTPAVPRPGVGDGAAAEDARTRAAPRVVRRAAAASKPRKSPRCPR